MGAFRRHLEFQISASFYDVITNDTGLGENKRNEKVCWALVVLVVRAVSRGGLRGTSDRSS